MSRGELLLVVITSLIIAVAAGLVITLTTYGPPQTTTSTPASTASTPLTTTLAPTTTPRAGYVRVAVVVDNNVFREGLATPWGISMYVETPSARFLFDTGPDSADLEGNAASLGIDLGSIDFVVISHEHGDHIGGLPLIARVRPGLTVYIPSGASPYLREHVRELGLNPVVINETTEVAEGVYVVKPLYGPPYEEAAAVETPRGLLVLVGCSHPGANNLVRQAVKDVGIKPYAVIGGFHLGGAPVGVVKSVIDDLVELGVQKIYPIHCSGSNTREYVAENYPGRYGDGGVGLEVVVKG